MPVFTPSALVKLIFKSKLMKLLSLIFEEVWILISGFLDFAEHNKISIALQFKVSFWHLEIRSVKVKQNLNRYLKLIETVSTCVHVLLVEVEDFDETMKFR